MIVFRCSSVMSFSLKFVTGRLWLLFTRWLLSHWGFFCSAAQACQHEIKVKNASDNVPLSLFTLWILEMLLTFLSVILLLAFCCPWHKCSQLWMFWNQLFKCFFFQISYFKLAQVSFILNIETWMWMMFSLKQHIMIAKWHATANSGSLKISQHNQNFFVFIFLTEKWLNIIATKFCTMCFCCFVVQPHKKFVLRSNTLSTR